MDPLQNNPTTPSSSSTQNTSIFRRCTKAIHSFTSPIYRVAIRIIRPIWHAIIRSVIYVHRNISAVVRGSKTRIQNIVNGIFSRNESQNLVESNTKQALRIWAKSGATKSLEKGVNELVQQTVLLEVLVADWLAASLKEGISEEKFFRDLVSIKTKKAPPRSPEVFNGIIKNLSSERGKRILILEAKDSQIINLSVDEARNKTLVCLLDVLKLENQIFAMANQSFPDISEQERLTILQNGLISEDHRRRADEESIIIGRSTDYCFGEK